MQLRSPGVHVYCSLLLLSFVLVCARCRYGIDAPQLQRLLRLDPRVRVFIIFIGSLGDQAKRLSAALPARQVHIALNTKDIPSIMKQCLLMSV